MSKFSTLIPVDIKAVIALLPKDKYVHSIVLNEAQQTIEIIWDSDTLKTAYTFPLDFPIEKLREYRAKNSKNLVDSKSEKGKK